MSAWVRTIAAIMAVAIAANLAVVLTSNVRNQRQLEMQWNHDEEQLRQILVEAEGGSRRLEITVDWQKLSDEGKVLESSLLLRQYRPTEALVPAGVVERLTIEGNTFAVEGVVAQFDAHFGREGRPASMFRGKRLVCFRRVFGKQGGSELDLFVKWQSPAGEWVGSGPTEVEKRAWAEAWDAMPDLEQAGMMMAGRGVVVKRFGPAEKVVQRGKEYVVQLTMDGVTVEEKTVAER